MIMQSKIRKKLYTLWIFILTASSLPINYIFSCGMTCFSCPFGGVCLLIYPIIIFLAILIKFLRKIRIFLSKILNHN
ncbi:MAG: hypothetical protein QXW62_02300 [Candidatus Methanomethylicaceae archaeon]|nr:hypothetical protein [Candidatus Verstraetearchaeota archaeon]